MTALDTIPRTARRRRAPGDSPDDPPGPTTHTAAPLPGGRAVVGALLVTVAAVGVFAAARSAGEGPRQTIVVANVDLPAGHRLEATDLRSEQAELPDESASRTFDAPGAVVGGVTVAALRSGEVLQRGAVALPGSAAPPSREFSFAVDRDRAVNGQLQRGERVDVLATFGTGDGATTTVVARDVPIVDADAGGRGAGLGTNGKLTVTVALTNGDDVLRLVHASQVAPLTLVRTTRAEGTDPGTLDTYRLPSAGHAPSGGQGPGGGPGSTTTTKGS